MYSLDSQGSYSGGSAAVVLTSSADGLTFTPGSPIEIISFGYITSTVIGGSPSSGFIASLDKRITAGSDTGRVASAFGTLTLTNAQVVAIQAQVSGQGYCIRSRPTAPTTGEGAFVVLPGQQVVLKITTPLSGGGVSGSALQFIEYKNLARIDQALTDEIIVSS